MKGLILVLAIVLNSTLWGKDVLVKTNPRTYQVGIETIVKYNGVGNSKIDLFLAYLSSNQYQICHQNEIDELAEIVHLGEAGDSCIYYDLNLGRKLKHGKKVTLKNEFILEVVDFSVDFDAINTIYPYDDCDPNYEKYTGSNFPFINVEQKQLFLISQIIWENSTDVIDYAENCYMYVAKSFHFGQPLSGFKSLEFILKNRSGDCGNLSSVFITLMRMQHIPARHLIGFRPDGSLHVWADFYLANYGWIPVDVTYKHDFPEGNYFGKIKFEDNGFIVHRGIGHEVKVLKEAIRIPGLQTYTYQVSYSKEQKVEVIIDREVNCEIMVPNLN